jgi:tetratricopeptide (TPR) repeat protein
MATSARIEELKQKFDENPRRYFAPLANELRKQGDLSQAISICRAHLPNQPGHVSGHIVLAQALYEATDFAESREEFQAALALDPENLIALRFMGDLSNASGDVEGARSWYQRVLDAEPRNYEIARIMRELDTGHDERSAAPDTLTSSTTYTTPVVSRTVTSESDTSSFAPPASPPPWTPTQEPTAQAAHAAPPPEPAAASNDTGLESPLVIDIPPVAHATPAAVPEVPPPRESLDTKWDAEAVSASEFSDYEAAPEDWFTNPADPAEELADDYEEEEYHDAPPPVASARADEDIESLFAAPDRATPRAADEPRVEVPTDPNTTGRDAPVPEIAVDEVEQAFTTRAKDVAPLSSATDTASPPPPSGPRVSGSDVPTVAADAGAESSTPSPQYSDVVNHEPPSLPASASERFDDEPATAAPAPESHWWEAFVPAPGSEEPSAEPSHSAGGREPPPHEVERVLPPLDAATRIGHTPEYVETVSEPTAAPFVTETLAELYLQQGFRVEALAIYRQLLLRNPSDDTLRNRVTAIESGSTSDALDAAAQSHAPHGQVSSSQSVRTFFGRLARRQPGRRASVPGSGPLRRTGEFPAQGGLKEVDTKAGSADPTPNVSGSPKAEDSLSAEAPSLTTLFNAPALSREDQDAAAALAAAFNSPAANTARPSRKADQELSLDHLFRNPASSEAASVSLDDFYSTPRSGTNDAGSSGSEPHDERAADIRQFTSWLEGLKKK